MTTLLSVFRIPVENILRALSNGLKTLRETSAPRKPVFEKDKVKCSRFSLTRNKKKEKFAGSYTEVNPLPLISGSLENLENFSLPRTCRAARIIFALPCLHLKQT